MNEGENEFWKAKTGAMKEDLWAPLSDNPTWIYSPNLQPAAEQWKLSDFLWATQKITTLCGRFFFYYVHFFSLF